MRSSYKRAMRYNLQPHPNSPCTAVSGIEVEILRARTGNLLVHYYVTGGADLIVPSPRAPSTQRRADELWQHTCFEAFVKPAGGEAYWEFNVAPTWDWQAYALSGYRAGRRPADAIAQPMTENRCGGTPWELRAHWALADVVPNDVPWHVGLAAVIEDKDGAISYWALAHAPDKPDFHHASAFALELPVTA
jgi:hypothetical protein